MPTYSLYQQLSYTANSNLYIGGFIKEIGYDSNNPAIQGPISKGGTNNTYISDSGRLDGNRRSIVHGMFFNNGPSNQDGLWHNEFGGTDKTNYISSRLLYIPSEN